MEENVPVLLDPFVRRLLGVTVTGLWQLAAVSDDGVIPLPGELVLETGTGFVSLSYNQDELSCRGPSPRRDLRWETEPWLEMYRSGEAEEWLELVPLDAEEWRELPLAVRPALPLSVTAMTGWFAVASYSPDIDYVETYALILSGGGHSLVIMSTDDFDLKFVDRPTARKRTEGVVANLRVRLVEEEQRL
jgi:hypothetical protein